MTAKTLVLGATGMLGSAVVDKLSRTGGAVHATARNPDSVVTLIPTHAYSIGDPLSDVIADYGEGDFVVNCIGMIKQRMNDSVTGDRLNAIRANAEFPHALAAAAAQQGFRVIQIATDCVYSGSRGHYTESSNHDAGDVYGKSKSLGEVPSPLVLHLRCSIVGEELRDNSSLMGWLLSQPRSAVIRGYTDHIWNGVTTSVFADIVAGLIEVGSSLSGTHHLIPADWVTKDQLSRTILTTFDRSDVTVVPTETGQAINRTLATDFPDQNIELWNAGGYDVPPRVEEMVQALRPTT